ncbi:MAG: thiamine phosphate synthase [Pseudomonadota bacterium]
MTVSSNNSGQNVSVHDRCRLVLMATGDKVDRLAALDAEQLTSIFSAGDVASLILSPGDADEARFLATAGKIVGPAQAAGIAVLVSEHTRVAGRIGADGLQLGQDPDAVRDAVERLTPKMLVGAGNVKTRHNALVLGEMQPDYVMFGKPGGDIRPEPHPKNLDLGAWWSAMVELPCIVCGGSDLESVVAVSQTGADFVALENAIFSTDTSIVDSGEAARRVAQANALLNDHAPRFESPDA